jgi:hypothetical protein
MLGRLALVIHWGLYLAVVGAWAWDIDSGAVYDWRHYLVASLASLIPFVLFTIIYWIVKKHWAFFPWQHVKPQE